jgi:hypothetical protein
MDSSDDDEVDVRYVRTPVKSHHATYKTPRKDLFDSKGESGLNESLASAKAQLTVLTASEPVKETLTAISTSSIEERYSDSPDNSPGPASSNGTKLVQLKKAIASVKSPTAVPEKKAGDIAGQLNKYLAILEDGGSLRETRMAMKDDGADQSAIEKMLALLDELSLRDDMDMSVAYSDKSPSSHTSPASQQEEPCVPEELLVGNYWRMSKFTSVSSAESKAKESYENELTSPRRKLILYNVTIGLSQLKSLGTQETLLNSIYSLDTQRGRITSEHLDILLQILPASDDIDFVRNSPLIGHPAEDFIGLAMAYYPDLPNRLYSCFICSQFSAECNAAKTSCRYLIDGCNQVLSSDNLALLIEGMLGSPKELGSHGTDSFSNLLTKSSLDASRLQSDLTLLDTCVATKSAAIVSIINRLQSYVNFLEAEQTRSVVKSTPSTVVLEKLSSKYLTNVTSYLDAYTESVSELLLMKKLLGKKTAEMNDYFGESSDCPLEDVFVVIRNLVSAAMADAP